MNKVIDKLINEIIDLGGGGINEKIRYIKLSLEQAYIEGRMSALSELLENKK